MLISNNNINDNIKNDNNEIINLLEKLDLSNSNINDEIEMKENIKEPKPLMNRLEEKKIENSILDLIKENKDNKVKAKKRKSDLDEEEEEINLKKKNISYPKSDKRKKKGW